MTDAGPVGWDLTDEELDRLGDEDLAAYQAALLAESTAWILTPRQQRAEDLAANVDEIFYGGAAGGGKMLALDTPVPTPDGWTTMGALRDDDELFDERGQVCRVVRAHPIALAPVSYRLRFDDGTEIVACADHQWLTYIAADLSALTRRDADWMQKRRAARPSRATGRRSARFTDLLSERNSLRSESRLGLPAGTLHTTADIAATLRTPTGRANHAVAVAAAIECNSDFAALPIDPYLLGIWLGDGSSRAGQLTTADPEVISEIEKAGYVLTKWKARYSWGIAGLFSQLRDMGLLGAKHVPPTYLRAGAKDRLALLQGLMDSDGTATRSGSVEFCNTNQGLVLAVRELALSLGHKVAQPREGRARLDGRDCGPKWTVKWTAPDPVFRLPRKAARQRLAAQRRTTRFRYIVACEPVPSVPMRCITVDSPSSLYLCSRSFIPTHNSQWALWHAYHLSQRHERHSALILRRSFPELRRTLIKGSLERFDQRLAKYRVGEKTWTFANGSIIEFGYADLETDVMQYLSAEYDLIVVDEASEFTEYQLHMLRSRCRTTLAKRRAGVRPHLAVMSNPGGVGGPWLKQRYVEATDYGERTATHDGRVVAFVPAKVSDNPYIDPDYVATLRSLPEGMRRKYLDGDWDTFEGMFFSEWRRDLHVVDPFPIPEDWPRLRGIDYGYSAPFACVWIAFDADGVGYLYRELYERQMTPRSQAQAILAASKGEKIVASYLDPSCWARTGIGESVQQQYRSTGLLCRRAMNARRDGWARVRDYLAADDAGRIGLQVFSTCTNFIRAFPTLVHDPHDVEDLDTRSDDHLADALRYVLITRAQRARRPLPPDERGEMERRVQLHLDRLDRRKKGRYHDVLGRLPA